MSLSICYVQYLVFLSEALLGAAVVGLPGRNTVGRWGLLEPSAYLTLLFWVFLIYLMILFVLFHFAHFFFFGHFWDFSVELPQITVDPRAKTVYCWLLLAIFPIKRCHLNTFSYFLDLYISFYCPPTPCLEPQWKRPRSQPENKWRISWKSRLSQSRFLVYGKWGEPAKKLL